MTNYTVIVKQYNCFVIEADNPEDAKRIAIEEERWDETDPNFECNITVEKHNYWERKEGEGV